MRSGCGLKLSYYAIWADSPRFIPIDDVPYRSPSRVYLYSSLFDQGRVSALGGSSLTLRSVFQ